MHNHMPKFALLLFVAFAGLPLSASAVYKCKDANDRFIYQDAPCAGGVNLQNNDNLSIYPAPPPPPPEARADDDEFAPRQPEIQKMPQLDGDFPQFGSTGRDSGHFLSGGISRRWLVLAGALIAYLSLALSMGVFASLRSRSFWLWLGLALLVNPFVVFFILLFRAKPPALSSVQSATQPTPPMEAVRPNVSRETSRP